MKVNVRGLVFVGFAAAILSGAANAEGDANIVTSKAYTDATYQAKTAANNSGKVLVMNSDTAGDIKYVATATDLTAVNDTTTGAGDKLATASAVKAAMDSVANGASGNYQTKLGGANQGGKIVTASENAGTVTYTEVGSASSDVADDGTKLLTGNAVYDYVTAQQALDEKVGNRVSSISASDTAETTYPTTGAVVTYAQGKNATDKYEVNKNGTWTDIDNAIISGTAVTKSADSNTGALTIGVDTVSDFTNVNGADAATQVNNGKIPTASAIKTYVDSQATSAASGILTSTTSTTDSTHALTNAATTTALNAKQDASTAVTHTANTAAGSATTPVYIADTGVATPVTVDSAVSTGSSNLVTSGAVATAINDATHGVVIPAMPSACNAANTHCALVASSDGTTTSLAWTVMAQPSNP